MNISTIKGLVVVALAAGLVLFFVLRDESNLAPAPINTPVVSEDSVATPSADEESVIPDSAPESNPEEGEIVNLKTYSRNGLTFKYPSDWVLNAQGQYIRSPDFKSEGGPQKMNFISGASIGESQTVLADQDRTAANFEEWGRIYFHDPSTMKKKVINGYQVVRFEADHYDNDFGWKSITTIFFFEDGRRASVRMSHKEGDLEKFIDVYDEVVRSVELGQ